MVGMSWQQLAVAYRSKPSKLVGTTRAEGIEALACFNRRFSQHSRLELGQDGMGLLDGGAIFETPREEDEVALMWRWLHQSELESNHIRFSSSVR